MKFAISAPQTVTLVTPNAEDQDIRINFTMNGADSSRCKMQVMMPGGETHELTFNTGGSLVDSHYLVPTDEDMSEEERMREPVANAHIVDGRDTRAFNPYTHVAPVDADTAAREAISPTGFTAPPANDETRQLADEAKAKAAEKAKEDLEHLKERSRETAEEREARKREEEDRAWEQRLKEQDSAGAAASAPGESGSSTPGTATAETFPSQKTQDLVMGKDMVGDPNPPETDAHGNTDPLAPAPSSPQPGSPPPHPLSQPDPGRVTTSKDFSVEPSGTPEEQARAEEAKADGFDNPPKDPVTEGRKAQENA